MANPTKVPAPPVMEQTLTEFGTLIAKLRTDVTLLVQGNGSKLDDVILDLGEVAGGIRELILGLATPPMVGSTEELTACKEKCEFECNELHTLVSTERPRFMEAGAGGSLTEGAKIDNILALIEKLLPLIKLLF